MRKTLMILTVLPIAALALSVGCGSDKNPGSPDPGLTYPYPDTPDQLMANFKAAYDQMDAQGYDEEILRPNFVFKFAEDTPEPISGPTGLLTREQELTISTNMFSGAPGVDP